MITMPEVSEVALTAEILLKYLKNKILTDVDFVAGRYSKKSPEGYTDFINALPLKVRNINSKGKFMWFDLVDPKNKKKHWYIWNTYGLTGMWSMYPPDKYLKAVLTFSGNRTAYFSDLRNFGTFKFSDSIVDLDFKLQELGPDFLKQDFDITLVKKYKIPIVKILMDQKKVGSGLGNYLVAEVLYCAGISPHRAGNDITDAELNKLDYCIRYLTKLAYTDNHTGYMTNLEDESSKIKKKNYHPEIKLKNKKTFNFNVYRRKKDPDGNKVKPDKIIKGRTTYWVPAVQK